MKKKPAKRTQSKKKTTKRVLNVLSSLDPLYGQPREETKVPMEHFYKAVKWATAGEIYSEALEKELEAKDRIMDIEKQLVKLRAKRAWKRSVEIRRKNPFENERTL